MAKLNFQHPLLQFVVSHDPSEIILISEGSYYQCWKQMCCLIFVWTPFSRSFNDPLESSKEQGLFKIEIFCNILNVFTITFDWFNASLLNKSIIKLKKTYTDDSLFSSQIYNIFPRLVSLFPGKHHQLFKDLEEAREYCKREAHARMNILDSSCPQDFIEAFVLKMKEVNNSEKWHLKQFIYSYGPQYIYLHPLVVKLWHDINSR